MSLSDPMWFSREIRSVGLRTTTIEADGYVIGKGNFEIAFIPAWGRTIGLAGPAEIRRGLPGTSVDAADLARLLSAAPDLLALLQVMRDRVRSDEAVRRYGEACEDTPVASFVEEIDAVLTRALGEKA